MATIPTAPQLGNFIPQVAPVPVAQSVDAGRGQAGLALARTGLGILEGQQREQDRLLAEQQREAEQIRKTNERARASASILAAQDDLAAAALDLGEGIQTGAVKKDQAAQEWQRIAAERSKTVLDELPGEYRELAQSQLGHRTNMLARGVTKAVTQRNQAEIRSSIDTTLESAQRMYLQDPAAADAIVDNALASLGPDSGLDPQQLGRLKQGYRESSRYNQAFTLVNGARRDNAALSRVEQQLQDERFSDLDPQRRATLFTQIEGFKVANEQRAEAAARRAEAQSRARLNRATTAFTAASALMNGGKVLSDEFVQQLTQTVAGTEYAKVLPELLRQAPQKSAFGQLPLPQQQAALLEARAQLNQRGTDPTREKQVQQLETIYQQSVKDYTEDPLPAAQERGLIQSIAPLQLGDLGQLVGTMGQRVAQAEQVSATAGRTVSPFLKAEAEQVGKLINLMPVEQRSTAIAQIAEVAGPAQAAAIGRQMAPKDKALGIALGMAGSKTTSGRYSSELVLRGAQAIKDRAVKEDNAAITGVRGTVAAAIGDAVSGPARETLIDAAVYTQYGLMSEGSGDVQRAIRLATGGVTERAGKKVMLPYGIDEATFAQRVQQVNAQTFASQAPDGQVYIAGKPMPVDQFAAQVPNAALITGGNGRYYVQAAGGVATNKAGRPIVLEVR